jgi:hypothetical protein
LGIPFTVEVHMSRKPLSLGILIALVFLAACSDVTGPQNEGFCPITGGSGDCVHVTAQH